MKFPNLRDYIPTFWSPSKPPPEASPPSVLPFLHWLNIYIVRVRDLITWQSRLETLVALGALHVFYGLYGAFPFSLLSLGSLTGLTLFTHYTLRVRLWNTISINPNTAACQPLELSNDLEAFQSFAHVTAGSLIRIRSTSPGFFLISSLFSLTILAYVGTLVSGFLLVYLLNMGLLCVPLLMGGGDVGSVGNSSQPDIDLPDDSLESFDILEPYEIFKDSVDVSLLPGMIPGVEDEEDSLREEDFLPVGFRETLGL